MLACSYGRLNVLGWADYTSYISVWNPFRVNMHAQKDSHMDDSKSQNEPELLIEVQCAAVSL